MQNSPEAQVLTEIAHQHAEPIDLTTSSNQIVVEDTRLRNWILAAAGNSPNAFPVRAILTDDGNILRIRTRTNDTLHITYATPGDVITWSADTTSEDALRGTGVDLWAEGAEVDAFWVGSDDVSIKTMHSSDYGHTWGSATTIHTLDPQGTGVLPQLCAPALNTLIFSDSKIGTNEEFTQFNTGLYITMKIDGSWIEPVLWDLGGQELGIERLVELPNGLFYPSNLSGVAMSETRLALAYFGRSLRESFIDCVWTQRVANLDYENEEQNLHWASPEVVFPATGIDGANGDSLLFEAFPRIQIIGNEYWVIALECSEFAGHQRYHLAFHRSSDGIHWSDRNYNQGAANDEQEGAYCYNGNEPFLFTDLLYANLIVTQERTFIVGFDKVFFCPSTSLVGIDNPQRKFDLTPYVNSWSMDLPMSPNAVTSDYQFENLPKEWNDQDIVAAHNGIRVEHRAGYYDPDEEEDVLIKLAEFNVDVINQTTTEAGNSGTLRGVDDTALLDRYQADAFWDWQSAQEMVYERFCDTTPFIVTMGGFTTGFAGRLRSSVVKREDNFPDDIAVFNLDSLDGGIATVKFRCDKTWEDNRMGIAFQGRGQGDGGDNKIFWTVMYNRKDSGRFELMRTRERNSPNKVKLFKYRPAVAQSDVITLDENEDYWFRVAVWHSHVMAWYTTVDISGNIEPIWTKVIDYVAPADPPSDVIPCRLEWWGLIGTQRTEPSGAIGNTKSNNEMQPMQDGSGNPYMIARRIHLGDEASIVRKICIATTQENESDTEDPTPMPDLVVMLLTGDENSPNDATDEDNVLFERQADALMFGAHDSPGWVGANPQPNPERVKLGAGEYVWIAVTPNGTLTADQSYKFASSLGTPGATKQSADGGVTWGNPSGGSDIDMTCALEVEYLNGRVKFYNLFFGSGDPQYTYEDLSHHIAAKAGVLDIRPDDWLNQSELEVGLDGFYWQPIEYGTIDDFAVDMDVTLNDRFEMCMVSLTTGDGFDDGLVVRVDCDTQNVSYFVHGSLIGRFESLQYVPVEREFHLRIVKRHSQCYVYINECLAAVQYDPEFSQAGYVGFNLNNCTMENMRIPDLTNFVKRWEVRSGQSALSSLQELCAKPAPGTTARARFFIDYDGRLRISTFLRGSVADTYEDTLLEAQKRETMQGVVSHIAAVGNYYADRWNPRILDTDGHWFTARDVTDGLHDRAAYRAAEQEFRSVIEEKLQHEITHVPVWAIEREDLNQLINPVGKTSVVGIVDSLTWSYDEAGQDITQQVNYRTFAGELVEME